MNDTQSQAVARFVAVLIATLASGAAALLASPELRDVILGFGGGDGSLVTALILALLPPIIAAVGKYAAGPTEKAPDAPAAGARGRAVTEGRSPGLFG